MTALCTVVLALICENRVQVAAQLNERSVMSNPSRLDGDICLYLDDLHVGQRFSSGVHSIDDAQIKAFASQFDPQPFHLDDEIAKTTMFGGLIASGCTRPRLRCVCW